MEKKLILKIDPRWALETECSKIPSEMGRNNWDWRPWLALGLVVVFTTLLLPRCEIYCSLKRHQELLKISGTRMLVKVVSPNVTKMVICYYVFGLTVLVLRKPLKREYIIFSVLF